MTLVTGISEPGALFQHLKAHLNKRKYKKLSTSDASDAIRLGIPRGSITQYQQLLEGGKDPEKAAKIINEDTNGAVVYFLERRTGMPHSDALRAARASVGEAAEAAADAAWLEDDTQMPAAHYKQLAAGLAAWTTEARAGQLKKSDFAVAAIVGDAAQAIENMMPESDAEALDDASRGSAADSMSDESMQSYWASDDSDDDWAKVPDYFKGEGPHIGERVTVTVNGEKLPGVVQFYAPADEEEGDAELWKIAIEQGGIVTDYIDVERGELDKLMGARTQVAAKAGVTMLQPRKRSEMRGGAAASAASAAGDASASTDDSFESAKAELRPGARTWTFRR